MAEQKVGTSVHWRADTLVALWVDSWVAERAVSWAVCLVDRKAGHSAD